MTALTIYTPPSVPTTPLPSIRNLALAGGLVVGGFLLGGGIWAALAPLESAAQASGTVEVESHRKIIQHLEGGIIGAILVHDGEHVTAGQPLIRLDDTKARTTLDALQDQLWDTEARAARLVAERDGAARPAYPEALAAHASEPAIAAIIAGQDKIFETRRSLEASKIELIRQRIAETGDEIAGMNSEIDSADRRIILINEEIAGIRRLLAKGLERRPHLLQLQRDLADIEGKRGETLAQIARARQTIAEAQVSILNQQNDSQNEVANQLRDAQKQIHELGEQIQAAADVLARVEVRAPEDGTVTDLRVHTPGGVIGAGDTLLDLVPEQDHMIVNARIRPEDIDVVHTGLPALVRLLPYKQRRTPPIEGTLVYVSPDSLVDKRTGRTYYAARIKVDARKFAALKDVRMIPGMPAEISIETGESTPAMYALAPILDSFHRAFREK